MKKHSYTFKIDKPCSESWDKMTATEKGKFCQSCEKEVVDFSSLSDEEMIRVIEKSKGNICGRAKKTQLDRKIQIPSNVHRPYPVNAILAGLVVLTLLPACHDEIAEDLTTISISQPDKKDKLSLIMLDDSMIVMRGKVLTYISHLPVSDALVSVVGTSYTTKVDQEGRFAISLPYTLLESSMSISIRSKINEETILDVSVESIYKDQQEEFWIYDKKDDPTTIISVPDFDESMIMGNFYIEKKPEIVSPFEYLRNK
jgi:hypothetical protein